jgi:hypothetical protein
MSVAHWFVTGGAMCAALTGCYVYTPLAEPEPVVGSQITAELTRAGTDTLTREIGPGVWSLRGRVLANSDSDLVLSVRAVTARGGDEVYWRGEAVQVPKGSVERMQQRQFSFGRSLIIAIGAIGGTWLAWEAFARGRSEGGQPGGPGGGAPR